MSNPLKRILFCAGLIFAIYFGIIPMIDEQIVLLIITILAGLKYGELVVNLAAKVFPD